MCAILYACDATIRLPRGAYVHKRRVLRLRELQDPFPGPLEMPITRIRPWRPRPPHPFGLRYTLIGRRDGKQRP
jgi:hypothetical protein